MAIERTVALQQPGAGNSGQIRDIRHQLLPDSVQTPPRIVVPHRGGHRLAAPMKSFQQLSLGFLQTKSLFIQLLLPPMNPVHHARERSVVRAIRQFLASDQQTVTQGTFQPPV